MVSNGTWVSGFGSTRVGSVGLLTSPFVPACGLVKSAYIGTEAASSVIMHAAKIGAYVNAACSRRTCWRWERRSRRRPWLGAWAGKRTLDHLSERFFVVLVDVDLLISGLLLLIGL